MTNNEHMKEQIIKVVCEELKDDKEKSGAVLYSGPSALTKSRFYFMGFNPGGEPEEGKGFSSILDSVKNTFNSKKERCSEYLDPSWENSRHQKTIQEVARLLGKDIEDIFSANLIFMRSAKALRM